ncbi:MAG: alpha/beta hydrolase [Oculatellaceae cyanobacterium Prado106]|jgi:pimeloyl-ACP methyl ester carboxylesterase|nr:alpha/beta hydrolase [Oculatellaceae cyanobacterium Prado106]
MFIPLGFGSKSVPTALGQMVYYTADHAAHASLWPQNLINPESLVFLHALGGGSSAYEWSKVYPAFASGYRVLAPDLIGWGRSAHPAREYRVEDYTQTIAEFLQKTCDRPVSVMASGLTAAFTIRTAVENPGLFQSLILMNPAGLNDFEKDYSDNPFAQFLKIPILNQAFYQLGVANSAGIRGFLEQRQFAQRDRISPEIVEAYLQSAQQPNAEYAALSFLQGRLSLDLAQYIPKLQTPTVMIWGRKTEFTSPNLGERFEQLNPTVIRASVYLEDVRLTPHLETPAVAIGLIRRYLRSLNE